MSYCRFSHDSDVYVYENPLEKWVTCGPDGVFYDKTRRDCLQRLIDYRTAGYFIPEYALDRLREEIELEG